MKYYLEITDLDNDAFTDDAGAELARILREAAVKIEAHSPGRMEYQLRDINGNRVGCHGYK